MDNSENGQWKGVLEVSFEKQKAVHLLLLLNTASASIKPAAFKGGG